MLAMLGGCRDGVAPSAASGGETGIEQPPASESASEQDASSEAETSSATSDPGQTSETSSVTTAVTEEGSSAAEESTVAEEGPSIRFDLPTPDVPVEPTEECEDPVLVVRDFNSWHPDFESFGGQGPGPHPGLVLEDLGGDGTPVYNPDYEGFAMMTSAENFAHWYHDVPEENVTLEVVLALEEETPGFFVYHSDAFFPIDDVGFGNDRWMHNYHFTTHLHTSFVYRGGEIFRFIGDDDLWLFVDGRMALDLGGLHEALEGTVELDTLGLVAGQRYFMDVFHAERRATESHYHIETTIDCFVRFPEG